LLAIELMVGVQALEFRRPLKSSEAVERVAAAYRAVVPRLEADRVLHDDMEASVVFMRSALQGSPMLQKFQIS